MLLNIMELAQKQITAIRCAYADLVGVKQALDQGDIHAHDWKEHELSISDLEDAFPEINLGGESEAHS